MWKPAKAAKTRKKDDRTKESLIQEVLGLKKENAEMSAYIEDTYKPAMEKISELLTMWISPANFTKKVEIPQEVTSVTFSALGPEQKNVAAQLFKDAFLKKVS